LERLRQKAVSGVIWNSAGNLLLLVLEFGVGILLARLLSPAEFGKVGMVMVFLSLSEVFINSGFSQALIRKPECTNQDLSTAFVFNISLAVLAAGVLFMSAPLIDTFYKGAGLTNIVRILSVGLIISAFGIVPRVIATRDINFKFLNFVSLLAFAISSGAAILMAINGFGAWSLVAKTMLRDLVSSVSLLIRGYWKPSLVFSKTSFDYLFRFGSRMVASGLIGTFTNNFVYIMLGRHFLTSDVGQFSRAELFKNIPSQNVASAVTGVAYPVLAKVQDDQIAFKEFFRKSLLITSFVIIILMAGLMAVAKPLVMSLLGIEWLDSASYLELMCPLGMLYPLWTFNLNACNIVGRSDLYFKLQLVLQLLTLLSVFIGLWFGIKYIIFSLIASTVIAYCIYALTAQQFTH
jgi:teichuronic acid exporter